MDKNYGDYNNRMKTVFHGWCSLMRNGIRIKTIYSVP